MKRILCVVLVTGAITALWIAPSPALIHFGARIGFDNTTWDEHEVAGFTLGSGTATVTREAIDAPLLLGVSAGTGLLPILDLEIAAEAAIKKYDFTYDPSVGSTVSEEVSYSRVSLMATLKRDLMSFPPVKLKKMLLKTLAGLTRASKDIFAATRTTGSGFIVHGNRFPCSMSLGLTAECRIFYCACQTGAGTS